MLACHLLGLPAPRLKSLPCLNTSSLGLIGLLCGEQSKLGLGNNMAGNIPFLSANSQLRVPAGDPGPAEAPRSSMSPTLVRTLGFFLYWADLLLHKSQSHLSLPLPSSPTAKKTLSLLTQWCFLCSDDQSRKRKSGNPEFGNHSGWNTELHIVDN